jgi:signal peptidase I
MLLIRWFLSKRVRHAVDACRHVRKLARAQADLLPAENLRNVEAGLEEMARVLQTVGGAHEIEAALNTLERVVQKNLRPYPNPRWRENIEVLLVTGAVVLALRTFFIQPMAIPTGSAQPTLWGIDQQNWKNQPEKQIPGPLTRFGHKWWSGISYFHTVAKEDGTLTAISRPRLVLPFVRTQWIQVGGRTYRWYFSSSFENIAERAGLRPGTSYRRGDEILKMRIVSGDHLFVNRMIYNFRRPRRGETIVFSSEGLSPPLMPNTHYIKRLVAIGGDRVRIGDDRHLVINGVRLDASTPGFENVYSFDPRKPPQRDQYSGHVNDHVAAQYPPHQRIADKFPNANTEYLVPPNHLLAFGDNTMNSYDGRAWGAFPEEKLVGRAGFVFWPISERFGWGYR